MAGTEDRQAAGVHAIAVYKTVKGVIELALAALLLVLLARGLATTVQGLARVLREHFSEGWSLRLARLVTRGATERRVLIASLALTLDGVLTLVEGWALRRGHRWGPWVVVAATSALLPFEAFELARHVRPLRVAALVVNLAIAAYLAAVALREHRRTAPAPRA